MRAGGSLRFAVAMAWRESRASRSKMILAALVMALASASAFAIAGIAAAYTQEAYENAREWIAADAMAVYYGQEPTPEQWSAVKALGAESTLVSELPEQLSSGQAPDPISAEVKVVDPAAYPYYGRVQLKGGGDLRAILDDGSAAVSPDVLDALQVHVGDTIRIRRANFRIAAEIAAEPDRFAVPPLPLGRVIVSQQGFGRAADIGAAGFYRILLRAPENDRRALCSRLEEIFPGARVIDYTSRTPQTAAVNTWIIPFLNIAALLALAFGAIALGAAIHLHLLQSMDTLAMLKCLGAASRQIVAVYFTQIFALTLFGVGAGLAGGRTAEMLFAKFVAGYLSPVHRTLQRPAAIETIGCSLILAAATAWVPLSRIRAVSPFALLRRDTREKLPPSANWPAVCVFLVGFTAAAFSLARSWRAPAFLLACAAAMAGVYALARMGIELLRRGIRGLWLPWTVRQGIANLRRYCRQSSVVIVVLAAGVAFMTVALMGGRHLGNYLLDSMPFHSPNLLMLRVDEPLRAELSSALAALPGVNAPPQFVPTAWVALARAGDSNLDAIRAATPRTWIQKDWPASCSDSRPPHIEVVAGHWWPEGAPGHSVALTEDLARLFHVSAGSRIEFIAGKDPIEARVAVLMRIPAAQRVWWREIVFNCRSLPNAIYSGALSVTPDHVESVRSFLRERFPGLLFLDLHDLLGQTERIAGQWLSILRWTGALAAAMAGCLLLAVIASLRPFRVREIAILRALGARRLPLLAALAIEYFALGGLGGLLGALLGSAATALILGREAGIPGWTFDPLPILLAGVASAVLTAAVGVLGSLALFRPRPLEILRQQ